MHISFDGSFVVRKSPEEVFDFLADAQRFCPLLPGYKSMERKDDHHFHVTVSLGISHIRGNAVIKMNLKAAERPCKALYEGSGDVVAGSTTLTASFELERIDSGTRVNWKGQSQIVGRLPSLAGGMLEPLAKKNVKKLIDGLQAALA